MHREIETGFHWLQECGSDRATRLGIDDDRPEWYVPGKEVHVPQNAYLFVGDKSLLFDTLSPAVTESVLDELRAILGGDGLDYLVVSHPDVPHAGGTMAILREYPEATLVAPEYGSAHELYHLDDALHVAEGDTIDLGGYEVEFHEAVFLDAAVSLWMSERSTDTLLTVDWLGYPHLGDECQAFVDELDRDVGRGRLLDFHGRVLFWYQYANVQKVIEEIDATIERFDPSIVAPGHGLVIREDAVEYMSMVKDVVRQIDERGRVGTLG